MLDVSRLWNFNGVFVMKKQRWGTFIPYFGAKFMRAPKYPRALYDTIIEPFAGAAGYSMRHPDRNVILIDKSEIICGIWDYLIQVSSGEILALPLMEPGDSVRDLPICQEAQWLLGFWINQGSATPKVTMGGRASNRKFGTWGEAPRARIAQQVNYIRHWRVIHGDYTEAPSVRATWFIDSPYKDQGKQYKYSVRSYEELAQWCRSRNGQVMVCESQGADWLPFEPVTTVVGATHRITQEVLWVGGDGQ